MQTISKDAFAEKYGDPALYGANKKKEESLFAAIKRQIGEAATAGVEKMGRGFEQSQQGTSLIDPIEAGLKVGAGAIETVTSPLAPIFAPIGKGIEYAADKISDIPAVQRFSETGTGKTTARVAEDVADLSVIGGTVAGVKGAPSIARGAAGRASGAASSAIEPIAGTAQKAISGVKTAASDIIPTRGNVVNDLVKDAFGFTKMDIGNLKNSTGNMMGEWMVDNNLIGSNKATTLGLVNKFFADNYAIVRSEIGKVKDTYVPTQVPRVQQGLSFLKEQLDGTLGLEKQLKEIDSLLKKEEYTLAEIQRVKELIDEHTSIYKKGGDVKEGQQKQGLDEVRKELRAFIESEVQRSTGADIRKLNNNVQTAKGILEINKIRDVGVTSGRVGLRDTLISVGLFAGVNPLVGMAYYFTLKLAESPAARLRFARWLDSLPSKEKRAINDDLLSGNVPKEAVEAAGIQLDKP